MRRAVVIAAATIMAFLAGAVAWASIPDSSGIIHGCRKNSDGSVKVIDSDLGQVCGNGYTALNWSQHAITGAHVVSAVYVYNGTNLVDQDLSCPAGEVALSAALQRYQLDGTTRAYTTDGFQAEPIIQSGLPVGYHFLASQVANGPVHIYVTCALNN